MSLALNCEGGRRGVEGRLERGAWRLLSSPDAQQVALPVIICQIHTTRDAMPPLTSNRQNKQREREGDRQREIGTDSGSEREEHTNAVTEGEAPRWPRQVTHSHSLLSPFSQFGNQSPSHWHRPNKLILFMIRRDYQRRLPLGDGSNYHHVVTNKRNKLRHKMI